MRNPAVVSASLRRQPHHVVVGGKIVAFYTT
jgi:hypothetical protein